MKLTPKNLEVKHLDGSPKYQKLFRAVSTKIFGKGGRFTGVKDIDFKILEELDDSNLTNVCVVNTYLNDICKDETFWRNRLLNKYRFLLGNAENIIHNYKPKDILWKEYYVWLHGAIYGDQFFSYLYADILRRDDVMKILEYTYPDLFADMDQYHVLDSTFCDLLAKIEIMASTSYTATKFYFPKIVKYFISAKFNSVPVSTKKILMYKLGIASVQRNVRTLGEDGRYVYNIPIFTQKNIPPVILIKTMMRQMGNIYMHPDPKEIESVMYNSIDSCKEYLLEMEINLGRSLAREQYIRWGVLLGTSVVLGCTLGAICEYFSKK